MARLHEYQGKAILGEHGIAVPQGRAVSSRSEARRMAETIGGRVVLKVQSWVTGRKDRGGVCFADTPEEAADLAESLLGMTFGNFPVSEVLVEEAIDIRDEIFVSLNIDDAAQAPILLLDTSGGSGIEDRAESVARLPLDVVHGVDEQSVLHVLSRSAIDMAFHEKILEAILKIVEIARRFEARSLEVNPLVTTGEGGVMAADCRLTIDDYAVFRQPDLGIEIARELDHPATELERTAYAVERDDHRGTFYFAQLPTDGAANSKGIIGFHGAGGGGSMMSMDAVSTEGFTLANFCDTSGNPSAAKVYRAARIILAQPDLVGYFGSGSGVASQEQYHSAYGLAKAFREVGMTLPAVIRLGGNSEDRAVEILEDACRDLPGAVEGYRKDDTPAFCAERFAALVQEGSGDGGSGHDRKMPGFVGSTGAYQFPIQGGVVWIDHEQGDPEANRFCIAQSSGLLEANDAGMPVLAVPEDEVAGKDSEMIACEIECGRAGHSVLFVDMPIAGLDEPSPFDMTVPDA